ncbi:OsmC family protein [Hazenella coriacea]|uniref:Putative OsmC-like protein n=1 Tax=Hazenella coriacea TaxID=1179467 RepID=A0A4R3L3V6_9BACL|nr:OsmC family protein [Hazenella coriacea]TCS93618.1 putative OsmC-like protein [Hazenella coriacea]
MNGIALENAQQTAQAIQQNPDLKMRDWAAEVTWKGGVKNEIKIRDFAPFITDEPQPLGGFDEAPNPVEYLIGAAASCFAITFEVLASQAGITLEDVKVNITADLNAAVFLGIEEGEGGILNPTIKISAKTSASQKEVEEIAKVAVGKSPVISSLKTTIKLDI